MGERAVRSAPVDEPELPGLLPAALLGVATSRPPGRRSARDWLVDVVLFLVAVLGGVALYAAQADVDEAAESLLFADLLSGAGLCLALWWRRQVPVLLAVVAALVSTYAASAGAAALVALFTVAVHRRPRTTAFVSALHAACGLVFLWVRPDPEIPVLLGVAVVVLLVGAVVAWGLFARARRQLVVSLAERARRAETEQQLRVEQARATERTRIAREMHDVLAHRISLVSVHAGALEFRPDASPADVASSAAVIRATAHEALQDLRDILGVLRAEVADPEGDRPDDDPLPAGERPQPTLPDVQRLVEAARQTGTRVAWSCTVASPEAAPAALGRTVYRVAQEGLTNARKHAPAAEVAVSVSGEPGTQLQVTVTNGRPVGRRTGEIPGAGQGLAGLAERVALSGGRLEHGRSPDGGWRLAAQLPWPSTG